MEFEGSFHAVYATDTSYAVTIAKELRLNIYDYFPPGKTTKVHTDFNSGVATVFPHPLSHVCRQVRAEFTLFFAKKSLTTAEYVVDVGG